MRIAIFGPRGMLGKAIIEECQKRSIDFIADAVWIGDKEFLADLHEDAIINCVGKLTSNSPSDLQMVNANAMVPHILAQRYPSTPIIHVSTDCVFSGMYDAPYPVTWNPDPIDLYGRTKLVGEVKADHVLNVRTSFIGFDHGLMRWLLDQGQSYNVEGWSNAMWSGSTVWAVAKKLVDLALHFKEGGTEHLATPEPISKYDLLVFLAKLFNLSVVIKNNVIPVIDRSLEPTIILPSISNEYEDLSLRYKRQKVLTNG